MFSLMEEAFQAKHGKSEVIWLEKIQTLQMQLQDAQDRIQSLTNEIAAKDNSITRMRVEIEKYQVDNKRLSMHLAEDEGSSDPGKERA